MPILPRPLAALGLLALAFLGTAGCGRPLPRELALREAVAAKRYATGGRPASSGLWFYKEPEIVSHTFDGERRTVVLTSVDPWRWTGVVPPHGELHVGAQILPDAWTVIRGLRAWVTPFMIRSSISAAPLAAGPALSATG